MIKNKYYITQAIILTSIFSTIEGLVYSNILPVAIGYIALMVQLLILTRESLIKQNIENSFILILLFSASSIPQVNFLVDEGFITAETFTKHPGFGSIRIPGLGISPALLALMLVASISIFKYVKNNQINKKITNDFFVFFILLSIIGILTGLYSAAFSKFSWSIFIRDINRWIIIGISFSAITTDFNLTKVKKILLGMLIGICIGAIILNTFGVNRNYANEEFSLAFSPHQYLLLLPYLIENIKWNARLLLFILIGYFHFALNLLISGKTIITLAYISIKLANDKLKIPNYILFFLLVIFIYFFANLDLTFLGDILINSGFSVAGYKLLQINFLHQMNVISTSEFYTSSVGNLIAEFLTICNGLLNFSSSNNFIVGYGFGGLLPDDLGLLKFSNSDSYPQENFTNGLFSGFHLSIFNFLFWFGMPGILLCARYYIKITSANNDSFLNLFIIFSTVIYLTADKFDAILAGIIISTSLTQLRKHRNYYAG